MNPSQQSRVNAAIAYFFLGWIFLCARKNPVFRDPFVLSHARKATRVHLVFILIFGGYLFFVKPYVDFPLPLIPLSSGHVIGSSLFLAFTAFFLLCAYGAYSGKVGSATGKTGEWIRTQSQE